MSVVEMIAIEVCIDCLLLIANGECDPDRQEEVSESLASKWEGYHLGIGNVNCDNDHSNGDCFCEQEWFSWSSCDGCGSCLGGSRAHAWAEKLNMVRVESPTHLDEYAAKAHVRSRYGVEEISDDCAATIAAWWQSPGSVGSAFAALASGASVMAESVLSDVRRTRAVAAGDFDQMALDMLGTWVLSKMAS